MKFNVRITLAACAVLALASCGGGGDDACADASTLSVLWTYSKPRLAFPIGTTTTYMPTISGLPAACLGQASFRKTSGPDFLAIDPRSGVIYGNPPPTFVCVNTPIGTTGGCSTGAEFKLSVPGYSELTYRAPVDIGSAIAP